MAAEVEMEWLLEVVMEVEMGRMELLLVTEVQMEVPRQVRVVDWRV
jgi:hypothetical protein